MSQLLSLQRANDKVDNLLQKKKYYVVCIVRVFFYLKKRILRFHSVSFLFITLRSLMPYDFTCSFYLFISLSLSFFLGKFLIEPLTIFYDRQAVDFESFFSRSIVAYLENNAKRRKMQMNTRKYSAHVYLATKYVEQKKTIENQNNNNEISNGEKHVYTNGKTMTFNGIQCRPQHIKNNKLHIESRANWWSESFAKSCVFVRLCAIRLFIIIHFL